MDTLAQSMSDRQATIAQLCRNGMKWFRAETVLLQHEARASLSRLSVVLCLLLCMLILLLSGLLLASLAAVMALEPVTGSFMSAMILLALGETGLAVVLAIIAIAVLRRAAPLPGLRRRLATFRDMVWESTQ